MFIESLKDALKPYLQAETQTNRKITVKKRLQVIYFLVI